MPEPGLSAESLSRLNDANKAYSAPIAAPIFDIFAPFSPGDTAFFIKLASSLKGPVLELGVGTGRVAWPLAEAGHRVVGIDLAQAMLDHARGKADKYPREVVERIDFRLADMVNLDLGEQFALIILPLRTFQHLLTPDEQRSALEAIKRHLLPNGRVVIDLLHLSLEWCIPGGKRPPEREVGDQSSCIIKESYLDYQSDPATQVIRAKVRFEMTDANGDIRGSHETSWAVRWSLRQEMLYLFELTGFEVVAEYSDFQDSPPAYGKEQIWILSHRD